jgi:hypothetical protein
MDVIDRIKQSWDTLVKPYPIQARANQTPAIDLGGSALPHGRYSPDTPPDLQELILEISPLPPYSIIIGGCDDHSHLFLDLSDPAPGSILIVGNEQSGRDRLLESILFSSTYLNSPRRVRYAMIASDMADVDYLTQQPHCYKVTNTHTDEAIDLIYELADIADYRRTNQQTGSAILLAIHDLDALLANMDEDMLEQFRWLVQVGPEALIWTVATIDSQSMQTINPEIINHFGTRLIGSVDSMELVKYITGSEDSTPTKIVPGAQFSVQFNEDWIHFWIPSFQEVVS